MGYLAFGFYNAKHPCFVSWLVVCCDACAMIFAAFAYAFAMYAIVGVKTPPHFNYYAVIFALAHMVTFFTLFIYDVIFKSDTTFMSGGNNVASFAYFEENKLIDDKNITCIQANPWGLYRKHFVIVLIKIVMVILDIVVLVICANGWKCAFTYCE